MKDAGLVLAGGGAKGAYQARVVEVLEQKMQWRSVAGVSAGALNGSMICQGKTSELTEIWRSTRRHDVWGGGHSPLRYLQLLFGRKRGLYDTRPLQETLGRVFDPNDAQIPFVAGATEVNTGQYRPYKILPSKSYDKAQVQKARRFVAASTAVPAAVSPVVVGGRAMADGGIRNITPLGDIMKLEQTPSRIVVVLNSKAENAAGGEGPPTNLIEMAQFGIETLLNEVLRGDIATARKVNELAEHTERLEHFDIEVVEPSRPLGTAQDFSKAAHDHRREVAETDAKEFLQQQL